MDACSEGLLRVHCVIEKGGRIADHRSPLTVWDMTVICRGENKENGVEEGKKGKETDGSSLGLQSGRCWFDE